MGCGSSRDVVKSMGSAPGDENHKDNKEGNSNNVSNNSTTKKGSKKNNKKGDNNGALEETKAKDGSSDKLNNHHHHSNKGDEDVKDSSLNSSLSQGSTIPASDELYQNHDNSNNVHKPRPLLGKLPPLKAPRTARVGFFDQSSNDDSEINQNIRHVPVAFEVPAGEEDEEAGEAGESSLALIRRHPPRRLRKMVEDKPEEQLPSITHESLEEKVQQANQRRKQVLTQRVASARQKSARVRKPLFDAPGTFNPSDYGEIEGGENEEKTAPDYL